jgi:serine/threonine-protein kinase
MAVTSMAVTSQMLRFRVFGRPIVESPEGPIHGAAGQRKPLALLALLAVAGPRGMSRDKILAYLWPDIDEERAMHRLTQIIYSLRRDLGVDRLFSGFSDLNLNDEAMSSDVADFSLALAVRQPDRATAVYTGPFLDGFFLTGAVEFDHWVEEQRTHFATSFTRALEELAEEATANGDDVSAAHWSGRLAKADPLNARFAIRHMETLVRIGNRAAALRFARAHEALLREELDATPDPAVTVAAERLRAQAASESSVAVLPFANLSPERENDYFSDGMTEELTNALAQVPGLRVASRTSAFAFKGKQLDVGDIGARLGVRSIVEGSVRKVGNRIRITAQLIDTTSGYHVWSQTYDRTLADVFTMQQEISQAIVGALPLKAGSIAPPVITRQGTQNLEAYTLYLRGRHFALKRTCDALAIAIEYFEQAIELDPNYALAYSGVGECYTILGFEEFGDLPPNEVMPKAQAALDYALKLDARLAEGHAWRGVLAFLFEYDWAKAEAEFRQAIDLKPAYSLAHTWYGIFLGAMGRTEEGLARLHHAEQMDPMAITIQAVVAHAHYFVRDYTEALQRYSAVLDLDPDNIRLHAWIARLHFATGKFEHGLEVLMTAMGRLGRPPILLAQLGRFHAALSSHQEAYRIIEELRDLSSRRYVPSLAAAHVHRALGNNDEVFKGLESALEERSGALPFLAVEPGWDSLRQDPRFNALIQKLGLNPGSSSGLPALAHSPVAHQ